MENNNEIMNEGIKTMVEEVDVNDTPAVGNGAVIALGVCLTLAVGAGIVKLATMAYDAYKANKELRKPDHETNVEDEDVVKVATPK